MPNAVSLTCSSPHVSGKIQMEIFSISKYLVKSLINKNCPEPVMVLAWNVDHYLHFRKEIRWRQKKLAILTQPPYYCFEKKGTIFD